jgi:hypothetical protein
VNSSAVCSPNDGRSNQVEQRETAAWATSFASVQPCHSETANVRQLLMEMPVSEMHPAAKWLMRKCPRLVGVVFALCGAALFYWSLIEPVRQAETEAPEVELWPLGGVFGLMFVLIGTIWMIFGMRFSRILQPSGEESKRPAYAIGMLLGAAGLAIYFALQSYLEGKGYVFTR